MTVQSNVDGKFYCYDSWQADDNLKLKPTNNDEYVVNAKNAKKGNEVLLAKTLNGSSSEHALLWSKDIEKDTTIQ